MEAELDRSEYGLHRAGIAEIGGLIFVFAGAPAWMPDHAQAELRAALAPQGIDRAAVAHSIDYEVAANWKLVWQNNRECWHCHAGHPQYVRANFDIAPATARTRELVAYLWRGWSVKRAAGVLVVSGCGLWGWGVRARGRPGLSRCSTGWSAT